jgi:hypothetical protein
MRGNEPSEIKEPGQSFSRPTWWYCAICGVLRPHKALAKWHCQLPPTDDPRWAKLIAAAEGMP